MRWLTNIYLLCGTFEQHTTLIRLNIRENLTPPLKINRQICLTFDYQRTRMNFLWPFGPHHLFNSRGKKIIKNSSFSCNTSPDLKLVVEIQAAGNAYNSLGPGSGPSQRLVTTAWAKLNLFTPQQQLLSGYWKSSTSITTHEFTYE